MGSVGKCHSISDNHLCYNHTCFCVFMDTAVPASGGRLYKPKFFSTYCYLPIHPLCALSAFESLGCSQAAVLRDLRRDLVGLGAERTSWDTLFQERPCLHFHQRLLLARVQEGLRNGMLVQVRGCRETRGPHWVGQSRPLPLCLRLAPGWTPLGQRGEQTPGLPQVPWAGQPIWALPQDPCLRPHLPGPQAFPQSSLCCHVSP